MIYAKDFSKMDLSKAMDSIWSFYRRLPEDLQYSCAVFFPLQVFAVSIHNSYPPRIENDRDHQIIRCNTSFLLSFLGQRGVFESDVKLWDYIFLDPYGNHDITIVYQIDTKEHVERHMSTEWDIFYGEIRSMLGQTVIPYERPTPWGFTFLDQLLGKTLGRNEIHREYGYCDYDF